jgi:hypothetical protein
VLNGKFLFSDRIHELLISSLLLLPLLPIFSTLLLILRGDHLRRQAFAIIAWALALSGGLYLGLNTQAAFWKAWGLCLYTGLAIIALSMEGIRFQMMRQKDPG